MKKAMMRGFTLLETLFALAIFAVMISLAGLISHFTYATFSEVDRGLSEESAAGARFFDTVINRVMRASDTEIEDDGRTLIITANDGTKSKFALEGDALVYYANVGNPEQKQVLAERVKNVEFVHDYRNERKWAEGVKHPDGIWAPIYFYSSEGPYRVAINLDFGDLQMRSAAVPRLASKTVKDIQWLSPLVSGILKEIREVKKDKYAVVEAETIGIHTPTGLQPAENAVIFVKVSALAAWDLKAAVGKPVCFMGDVVPAVLPGQLTMVMNPAYGGGMALGEEQIRRTTAAVASGKEPWYEAETARLKAILAEAENQGVDLNDWRQLWKFLEIKSS